MSFQSNPQTATNQRDELVVALTNQHCRFVVRSFTNANAFEDNASIETLSAAFARKNGGDDDQAATHFHHTALPKLSNLGVVDYNVQDKIVRYHGHSEVEAVLASLDSDFNHTET